jgi:hypothetical protein
MWPSILNLLHSLCVLATLAYIACLLINARANLVILVKVKSLAIIVSENSFSLYIQYIYKLYIYPVLFSSQAYLCVFC